MFIRKACADLRREQPNITRWHTQPRTHTCGKLGGKGKAKWWNWMVMDECVNIATGM